MSCENDYLYYCITLYVIISCYIIKYQEKQEKHLKTKLHQEIEMNRDLLELLGLRKRQIKYY